jgi:hypothetical protein
MPWAGCPANQHLVRWGSLRALPAVGDSFVSELWLGAAAVDGQPPGTPAGSVPRVVCRRTAAAPCACVRALLLLRVRLRACTSAAARACTPAAARSLARPSWPLPHAHCTAIVQTRPSCQPALGCGAIPPGCLRGDCWVWVPHIFTFSASIAPFSSRVIACIALLPPCSGCEGGAAAARLALSPPPSCPTHPPGRVPALSGLGGSGTFLRASGARPFVCVPAQNTCL